MRNAILLAIVVFELALFTALERPDPERFGGWIPYLAVYLENVLVHAAPVLFLAFGMTLVLATGGIDLSVGSMVALVACAMSLFPGDASFWWSAVPLGLLAGLVLGFTNGALIARLSMPPIIATLGTMILYRGLCFAIIEDEERAPFLTVPGYGGLGEFAAAAAITALLFGAGGALLRRTPWRRELLMIGGNRVAARYAGIPVERRLLETYTAAGALAFAAALVFTARNGSVAASTLSGLELEVIVAVVLGGTRIQGGSASLPGSFLGVLAIALLGEGLRGLAGRDAELPFKVSHLRYLLLGALLVGGVWAQARIDSRRMRASRRAEIRMTGRRGGGRAGN